MSVDGADPLALDVASFTSTGNMPPPRARSEAIREVSEVHNFPSWTPNRLQRRRRTRWGADQVEGG